MNVLFVCTGNVCRSPMAEGFLNHEAERRGLPITSRSTGTHAWPGRAATFEGRRVMAEFGVPIDDHRTLELDDELMEWADLVIGLSFEHSRDTAKLFPNVADRIYTLKGFCEMLPSTPSWDEDEAWLDAVAAHRHIADNIEDTDVDDPFGERQAAYRRVCTEVQGLIERMAAGLEAKRASLPA